MQCRCSKVLSKQLHRSKVSSVLPLEELSELLAPSLRLLPSAFLPKKVCRIKFPAELEEEASVGGAARIQKRPFSSAKVCAKVVEAARKSSNACFAGRTGNPHSPSLIWRNERSKLPFSAGMAGLLTCLLACFASFPCLEPSLLISIFLTKPTTLPFKLVNG